MKLKYRNRKNAEAVAAITGKSLDKPDWFAVKAAEGEILVYDYIGWPYNDPRDLISALESMKGTTPLVRINSPGGDVFDGIAIYNALKAHGVNTRVEGLAASMASVIATSGKTVQIYSNSMFMIHNAWVYAAGNKADLIEIADILGQIDENLVDMYQAKSNAGKRVIADLMAKETWLKAKEAKAHGFIDEIVTPGVSASASFDLSMYANAPETEGKELTEREIERALRDAGASRSFAKSIVAGRNKKPLASDEVEVIANKFLKEIQSCLKN